VKTDKPPGLRSENRDRTGVSNVCTTAKEKEELVEEGQQETIAMRLMVE